MAFPYQTLARSGTPTSASTSGSAWSTAARSRPTAIPFSETPPSNPLIVGAAGSVRPWPPASHVAAALQSPRCPAALDADEAT